MKIAVSTSARMRTASESSKGFFALLLDALPCHSIRLRYKYVLNWKFSWKFYFDGYLTAIAYFIV